MGNIDMNIRILIKKLKPISHFIAASTLIFILIEGAGAQVQTVVGSNFPESISSEVKIGMVQSQIEFEVDEIENLIVTVIVPVPGAVFSLINPDSTVVVAHDSAEFYAGADHNPPLPGGVFATGEISEPLSGTWQIRLDYPAATEDTALLASIGKKSKYQVGIVLARNHVNTGEDVPIGILVHENGVPIAGLNPEFSVFEDDSEIASGIPGFDDGNDADGLAEDGIYSADYVFPGEGTFELFGHVVIPTDSGSIERNVSATVMVSDPGLVVTNIENVLNLGGGSCLESLDVQLSIDVLKETTFTATAVLESQSDDMLLAVSEVPVGLGSSVIDLVFPVDEIEDHLGPSDPYDVPSIEIVNTEGSPKLVFLSNINDSFDGVDIADFCVDPVEIESNFLAEPIIEPPGNAISYIEFHFGINVTIAGIYDISFKIFGPNGEDLGLFVTSEYLDVGKNTVLVMVDGHVFANIDGPYTIVGMIVNGPAGSAQQSILGTTQFFSGGSFVGATKESVPIPMIQFSGLVLLAFLLLAVARFGYFNREH
jgi:hypothetical protein